MLDLLQVLKADKGLPAADTASRLAGRISAKTKVYGWHVDPSVSDPAQAVTYLWNARGKRPASMGETGFDYGDWENAFFMPRPCMLKYDGTVDYYLDPNDYSKKTDGTASDVSNADYNGNAMMEWPLIWYKFEAGAADGEGFFYCANRQIDESYKCWCNVDSQNNITPHFYTSIYDSTGANSSKLRSISGVMLSRSNGSGYETSAVLRSKAKANDSGQYPEWDIGTYCDWQLISALLVLISKTLYSQQAFGGGMVNTDKSTRESYVTGTLNDKGLFWGDLSDRTKPVKIFGMENWWGCTQNYIVGLANGSDGKYKVKLTHGTADGSAATDYSTSSASGYLDTGLTIPAQDSYGWITKKSYSVYGWLPSECENGSLGTYYTDCVYNLNDGILSPSPTAVVGGAYQYNNGAGISFLRVDFNNETGAGSTDMESARISCKPIGC